MERKNEWTTDWKLIDKTTMMKKKTTCWIVNPIFYPLIDGHTVYIPQFIGIKPCETG